MRLALAGVTNSERWYEKAGSDASLQYAPNNTHRMRSLPTFSIGEESPSPPPSSQFKRSPVLIRHSNQIVSCAADTFVNTCRLVGTYMEGFRA